MFSTGGTGTGVGLGSQGALVLGRDDRWLFAVNAGSNEISVFAVRPNRLVLVDKVNSGGVMPISLTVHENLLYVLNAGEDGNITGFTTDGNGQVMPLPNSTRPLSGAAVGPAQIQFSPDGSLLVVTEKSTNNIDTYTVDNHGYATGPIVQPSAGMTPFGFAFSQRGQALIVSEAFGGAENASATSSYRLTQDHTWDVVSPSVPDTQSAACWVVTADPMPYAYVSNTGSGSISSYLIGWDGSLSLLNAQAGVTGLVSAPTDMAMSRNSRYLYVLNSATGAISVFRVQADGGLVTQVGVTGLPADGSISGLAAH
jgi:6-phosphogluconolactonase (cycloisomerase 2 family)